MVNDEMMKLAFWGDIRHSLLVPFTIYMHVFIIDLRAIIEELERQGLAGSVVTRAVGRNRNELIRKSVGPSDFRLRFGKRSASLVPEEVYFEKTQNQHHRHQHEQELQSQSKKWLQQLMQQVKQ